jgi:hypothetical protein
MNKRILSKMNAKETMILIREFIEPFYHWFLDDIRSNSSELLIMYHYTVPSHRFQTHLLYGMITESIRDEYVTFT